METLCLLVRNNQLCENARVLQESLDAYQKGIGNFAKSVFGVLDENLRPETIVIGLSYGPEWGAPEPFISPGNSSTEELVSLCKKCATSHKPPFAHPAVQVLTWFLGKGDEIKSELAKKYGNDIEFHLGPATLIESVATVPLLALKRSHLTDKSTAPNIKGRNWWIVGSVPPPFRSFLESAIYYFLEECRQWPIVGAYGIPAEMNPKYVLQKAGYGFMRSVVRTEEFGGGGPATLYSRARDTFETLDRLAVETYELKDTAGQILFCDSEALKQMVAIRFRELIPFGITRAVRKMVEASTGGSGGGGMALIANVDGVIGLADPGSIPAELQKQLFRVEFSGRAAWSLYQGNRVLMHVRFGYPSVPVPSVEGRVTGTLKEVFPELAEGALKSILGFVQLLTQQGSGTTIVVSDQARDEVGRLKNQGIPIEPTPLDPKAILVGQFGKIDGAIFLDPDATCHGVGVILDGLASAGVGDPSRGARYNSARSYLKSGRGLLVVIVISDDGMVNVLA